MLRWRAPLASAGGLLLLLGLLGSTPSRPRDAAPIVPVWDLTPAQVAASCTAALGHARVRIDRLVQAGGKPTFATVADFETVQADLSDEVAVQQFLFGIAVDARVRDASQQCNNDVSNFNAAQSARPEIYRLLQTAVRNGGAATDADRKLQELAVTASVRAGAALGASDRSAFVKLQRRLNDLQNAYQRNLAEDNSTIAIRAEQTAGLPPDFIAKLKPDAAGLLIVPVNESTLGPFQQNASDAAARKAYYLAFNNRGGEKNVALLGEALDVRDRLAHLLHYPTWAAYVLADRMAQSPERVNRFLKDLDVALLPRAKAERAELAALKGAPIDAWDTAFYENRLRKSTYDVDADAVKAYFPAEHTIDAILGVYAKLFSLTFVPASRRSVWISDVRAYDVHERAGNGYLGTFYLDLYPRPGKYGHFANFPISARRVLANGSIRAPLNAIVGNFPAAAPGKPALLTHSDVVVFFHEFGHNIAAMLAATPYATLNSQFRWDFVEAPSQMLENWAWEPSILKAISSEATTGAPMPDELLAKLIRTRTFDRATDTVGQVMLATVDMRYHTAGRNVDTTGVWRATVAETTPSTFVDGTHPQARIGHFMGGYDAGYYGYLWSKVYAQDMFTAFATGGLENPAIGRRYRETILAPARTYEPDAEVLRFLGRKMRPDAFYRELGLPVR
jgi:thimet oligopeptidase